MKHCNHVWINDGDPSEKTTADALLSEIKKASVHGYWLRGLEHELSDVLVESGQVRVCECGKACLIMQPGDKHEQVS